MTNNKTIELLRKLLDERGVEWWEGRGYGTGCIYTFWHSPIFESVYATANDDGTLSIGCINNCNFTPEQAIAATLGKQKVQLRHGTLTAGKVQAAIFSHSSCAGRVDGKYFAEDIRMQAIADELNGVKR